MVGREHWRNSAACRKADPEVFFPASYGAANMRDAVAWCSICPVAAQCLQFAVEHWQPYGIFAGLTPSQLATLAGISRRSRGDSFRELKPHPSDGAVTRHRRAREPLCDECAIYEKQRSKTVKAARRERLQQESVAS